MQAWILVFAIAEATVIESAVRPYTNENGTYGFHGLAAVQTYDHI